MIVAEKKNKQGRNEPCACGSGKKYKKCCGGMGGSPESHKLMLARFIQEAVAHHKSGNFETAEIIYRRVLSLDKNNADALQLLGEIAYQRKDYGCAADLIGQAVNINQTSPLVYANLGNALREIGKYEAAGDAFMRAIDLKPDALSAYENLADLIRRSKHIDEKPLRYLIKGLARAEISPKSKYGILVLLGYVLESSREWNEGIFKQVILPATKAALERGDYLFAYFVSCLTAVSYAQQPHTAQQWKAVHALTNPMYISAGEKRRKTLPGLVFPDCPDTSPILGFIIDLGLSAGSGATLLINLLRGFSKLSPLPFQCLVYTLDVASEALKNACSEMELKLVDLSVQRGELAVETDLFQRLLALRGLIQKDGVTALVYPGTYEAFPCLAASMGLAPVQIYLSMGFRSISIPSMNGYIVNGKLTPESHTKPKVSEEKWRTIPSSLNDPFPAEGSVASVVFKQEVAELRQEKFPSYRVILGSIGRPQKIESISFMNALARILCANPDAVFLWFGHVELVPVRQMMEERNISARCLFQGWRDARIYGKLLDIHLDSFPYAMGLSMHETMSAGTASVWMATQEDAAVSVSSDIRSLLEEKSGTKEEQEAAREIFRHPETGENLALLAQTEDEYVAYVQHLIDDESFRSAVGAAGKSFMKRFMHDPRIAAGALSRHILEIVQESRIASGEALVAGLTNTP